MKTITAAILALALSGCSMTTVVSPEGWQYSRTSFITTAALDEATMTRSDGTTFTIKGVKSDQSKLVDALIAARATP